MTRALVWTIAAATAVTGLFVVVLGLNLLPSFTAAATRGVTAQVVLTWLLIGGTVICAVLLTAFLATRLGGTKS